ncbi:MAG: iron-sulfur cluster assembly accessory protein [Gammaproteobacteria bacterium]
MGAVAYKTEIADHEIKVSVAAAEQLKNLLASIDEDIEGIRIFVSGGGCGGMTYGMTYAEAIQPYDKILDGDGYKIMVDPVALGYLQGSDIDFVDNGMSKSFVFNNVFKSVGGSGGCSGCGGGGCGTGF